MSTLQCQFYKSTDMYFVSTLDLSYNEIKFKFYNERKVNKEKKITIKQQQQQSQEQLQQQPRDIIIK